MITGLTLKTFAKHLTSEGFSMFLVVYWAKVSEPAEHSSLGGVRKHALFP